MGKTQDSWLRVQGTNQHQMEKEMEHEMEIQLGGSPVVSVQVGTKKLLSWKRVPARITCHLYVYA